MTPVAAGASVEPGGAMHAYVRARMADGDGAASVAAASYRDALSLDPSNLRIARRSYGQAIEGGDRALAIRAAVMLDQASILPRDGTLLLVGDAIARKDWVSATALTDRVVEEGNFAFLAPILRSWIALGLGTRILPAMSEQGRFAALEQRYHDEQVALLAASWSDFDTAVPAMRRAIALRSNDDAMRLKFARLLAAGGAQAEALSLLPENDPHYAHARTDITRGKVRRAKGQAVTPATGYALLLSRLAADLAADDAGKALGLRLARIATFVDPEAMEAHLIAARLLTDAGYTDAGLEQARLVPQESWLGAIGQDMLVDALAESGDRAGAIALARQLTKETGAGAERHVRLGRLLMAEQDYNGAAAAFRSAQSDYPPDQVPWTLLLLEGSALEQGQQWEDARVVLERAFKRAPGEPVVLNYLGYAQIERRQNVDAALGLLKRASALKPQDPSITDSLGWAQFVTGNVGAAVTALEQAAIAAPGDTTINEHLGDALWAAGRRFEARYAWTAAAVEAEGQVAERLAAKRKEGMKPEYAAP